MDVEADLKAYYSTSSDRMMTEGSILDVGDVDVDVDIEVGVVVVETRREIAATV